MSTCSIYKITNRITGTHYIGRTINTIEDRFTTHMNANGSTKFYTAVKQYGADNFHIELIEEVLNPSKKDADILERYYIKLYDTCHNGYNSDEGGVGGVLHHTEKTKEQISKSSTGKNNGMYGSNRSGKNNPMFGRSHTEEAKEKISKKACGNTRRLGAVLTKETKKKIGEANMGNTNRLGHINSKDHRDKISKTKLGKPNKKARKSYKITYPNGDVDIITGLVKYCQDNKLNTGCMSSLATGKLKKYKGFTCEILYK